MTNINQNTIDVLYGDNSSETNSVQTTEPDSRESSEQVNETVEALYPKADEPKVGNPYALEQDKDSVENKLYGSTERVEISSETDLSIIYSDPEQQEALRDNLGYMASTAGATQSDVESLVQNCNEHVLTNAEYSPDDVMVTLYEQHGKQLNEKLQAAQSLVASYPDLSAWLDSSGAGNNLKIINQIIKISESPRAQSRLNKLKQGIK